MIGFCILLNGGEYSGMHVVGALVHRDIPLNER